MPKTAVHLTEVSRRFQSGNTATQALSRISLSVEEGQRAAIIGPSGSGKTTLLNLIAALDRPDEGSIQYFARELSTISEREAAEFRRRHVGFVFQDDALMPELTVRENIELPLILIRERPGARAHRTMSLLEVLGLPHKAGAFPATLSAGEKQRVAVARAVAHRPSLLLADEPTANLDGGSVNVVLETLEEMARRDRMTVLLATHDPRVFERFGRLIRLEDGRLAEEDNDQGR